MPIVIYGVRGYTIPTGGGDFFCPECADNTNFNKKFSFNAVHLYWIPLIPFKWQSYVECAHCRATFLPNVLDWTPDGGGEMRSQTHKTILQTMAMMMMSDGHVDDREIAAIQDIYHSITGKPLSQIELMAEANKHTGGFDLAGALSAVRVGLNPEGCEMVLRAAICVAMADDHIADEEREMLHTISKALLIDAGRAQEIFHELDRPAGQLPPGVSPDGDIH